MNRLLTLLIFLFALNAQAGVVGIIGDSTLSGATLDSSGKWCQSKTEASIGGTIYTAGAGETVTEYHIYTHGANTTDTIQMAVYTVNASNRADSLYSSSAQTFTTTAGTTTQWYAITGLNIPLISGEDYCIAIGNATSSAVTRIIKTSATNDRETKLNAGCDFETPFSYGNQTLNTLLAYAVVETTAKPTVTRKVYLRKVIVH